MVHKNIYSACTSIIVGKKASSDGSIMIGRNEDSRPSWPKNYVIHPAKVSSNQPIYQSNDNGFKMPLPKHSLKYSATPEWTDKFGLFEEDGFNENGVAMSATESTMTNDFALGFDPLEKNGISEEAMITVVLPYVKTARQGVERLGKIIEAYGTSESNGILFADKNEAWYLETAGGHRWVAEKIPDNSIAIMANQTSIENIDFNDSDNFMWSTNLVSFIDNNHLNPADGSYNFRQIFGTHSISDEHYNTGRVWYGREMFAENNPFEPTSQNMPMVYKPKQKLTILDVQDFLSNHFQGTEFDPIGEGTEEEKHLFRPVSLATTQEGHILQIRPNLPVGLAEIQWLAMGMGAQSTFVPFFAGANDTPKEYQNASGTYAPNHAYWTYKLAGVLVDPHYHKFGKKLADLRSNLRTEFLASVKETDQRAKTLSGSELSDYVTKVNFTNAKRGLVAYNEFISETITASTGESPIRFEQNMNL